MMAWIALPKASKLDHHHYVTLISLSDIMMMVGLESQESLLICSHDQYSFLCSPVLFESLIIERLSQMERIDDITFADTDPSEAVTMTVSAPDATQWSTLQVGNIPGETSRYQLEHFFSDIGPVKKCFTVKREFYNH